MIWTRSGEAVHLYVECTEHEAKVVTFSIRNPSPNLIHNCWQMTLDADEINGRASSNFKSPALILQCGTPLAQVCPLSFEQRLGEVAISEQTNEASLLRLDRSQCLKNLQKPDAGCLRVVSRQPRP